ncbi:hypothetical protein N7G274_005539 [Stereocaulon virgatum]|uniref:Uncharacterized protein n=1 Tax=Stereocaulon virgatum TaxID=373712 RepID=A0ABR4A8E3_9LECA
MCLASLYLPAETSIENNQSFHQLSTGYEPGSRYHNWERFLRKKRKQSLASYLLKPAERGVRIRLSRYISSNDSYSYPTSPLLLSKSSITTGLKELGVGGACNQSTLVGPKEEAPTEGQ